YMVSAEIREGPGGSSFVFEGRIGQFLDRGYFGRRSRPRYIWPGSRSRHTWPRSPAFISFYKILTNGDLEFGVFRQGDADGVTDAIFQEGADADGRFDPPVFAISGFGDAEVQGVTGAEFFRHIADQQAVGLDHDQRVAGFHAEDNIVITLTAGHAQEFHGAFHHAHRRISIAAHDTVTEGTVIRSYPHGRPVFLTDLHQRGKPFADT